MPRPGIEVTTRADRARRGAPTDTGVLFIAGPTSTTGQVGKVTRLDRISDYGPAGLGTRSGAGTALYDYLDTAFAEGLATAYVSALAPTDAGNPTTIDTVSEALAVLTADLGPGQVTAAGYADADRAAVDGALLDHAAAANRTALLDGGPANDTVTELVTLAGTLSARANADRGGLFAGTVSVPGVAGSTTTRSVPLTAAVAGLIARGDSRGTVADAPAGERGYFDYVLSVEQTFTDDQRTALTEAGVNIARQTPNGGPQLYGFRGVSADETWQFLTNQRLRMSQVARLGARAEQVLFRSIDGEGRLLAELRSLLLAELDADYRAGALFGRTAEDAYDVDVSPAVNRPETIANGEVYATVLARYSPFTELARIDLVKAAVGGPAF